MPIVSHLTAREIAAALHRGRKSGAGFIASCPAHEDRNPSLSLRDGRDGAVLVHCHTGCSQRDVIDSLRGMGLWPERARRWLTRAEWDEQRQFAAKMRERMRDARFFAVALEQLLELALEELPPIEEADWDIPENVITERAALSRTLMEVCTAQKHPLVLAGLYADWQRREPKLTTGLVHAGEQHERHWAARIWRWMDAPHWD
jgi:hypothetical protein